MTGLTARYEHLAETPAGPLLAVVFGGTYAPGSEGNAFAREMVDYLRSILSDRKPAAVLFDLTALDYVWGDAIGGLAIPLMEKDEESGTRFLPSAIVATGQTARALRPLLERRFVFGLAGTKLFGTRQEAVAYLETVRPRERRRQGQEPAAAKRLDGPWPVVEAILRSATLPSVGLDPGPAAALHYLVPLGIIWGLVELVRGHRVTFAYTYSVAGKYYVGYAHRFVRNTSAPLELFGRAVDETIHVRYNPEKPAFSEVRAEDNAPAGAES